MRHEDLASFAMDTQDFMCYVIDIETYKLLYINRTAKEFSDCSPEDPFTNKTCYELLHGRDTICESCNTEDLSFGKKIQREMQNEKNKRYYSYIDTLIEVDGRPARLTFGFDSSRQREQLEIFTQKLSFEETLIKCIHTLIEDTDIDNAIMNLLGIVGEYYKADRAYLFEVNAGLSMAKNTYEWSANTSLSTINTNSTFVFDNESALIERFKEDKELSIYNIETAQILDTHFYTLMQETNTHSLLMVPLFEQDVLTSFIGVDNPQRMATDLSLLHSVVIFIADDIKKRKTLKQLAFLSYTDLLTGLYNRNKYVACLEELDPTKLHSLGLIHATVNGLKKMNELYGEEYGDSILKQVAVLLSKNINGDVFRLSGDEFIAVCQNLPQEVFETTIKTLRSEENKIEAFSFAVGGVWQDKKIDIHQGLTQAGEIMYAEKQNYYKAKATDKIQSRANSVEILLDEIRSGCFSIYLQPKVNLNTHKISGAEALIRKHNSAGKLIPPDRFIPIYENEGTIRHLDFFVLEEACILLQELLNEGRPLKISVNFSRVTFIYYDLIDEVVKTCAKYAVPHEYIKIEITESIDKMDFEFFNEKLKNIKDAGFEISLDDFGAKHSNLLMLTTTEFSEVKIDKGLIDNIAVSSQNRTLVRNIIRTIKELGTSTCVAEGIETKEQKNRLQDYGCTYGQGYYFYRPMPINEFLRAYEENRNQNNFAIDFSESANAIEYQLDSQAMAELIDAMPLCMTLLNYKRSTVTCNKQAVRLFEVENKAELTKNFFNFAPEKQPDGTNSSEGALYYLNEARNHGYVCFPWLHYTRFGEELPTEVALVKLNICSEEGDPLIAGFIRDLRPQLADDNQENLVEEYFFNRISDKTLLKIIAEFAAEWFWTYDNRTEKIQFFGKGREILQLPATREPFPSSVVDAGMVYEEDLEAFMAFADAMKKGLNRPTEVRFVLPNGEKQHYKIVYRTIYDKNNKPLFSVGKTYNIDDQIRAKEKQHTE